MRNVFVILFAFLSVKGIGQFEKVSSGTIYTYRYTNALTTNGNDTEDTLSKKVFTYTVKIDTLILFNKNQSRLIVFDKIIDPFLNYKGDIGVSQKQTIYLIRNDAIFSLRVNAGDFKSRMAGQNFVDRFVESLTKKITKVEYKSGVDVNSFTIDGILVDFFPFLKIKKNEVGASDEKTSYTGYYKFYKYTVDKKTKNVVVSEAGEYLKNDFLRKTDATVYFSPLYGLIKSSASIVSGESNNVFKLELIKVESKSK